jgi:hypothetical protein
MSKLKKDVYIKTGLHSISPYVGKLRPEIANNLIKKYSEVGDIILDPFCGSGTIALEAWINNRVPMATDLNFYAYVLTKAKLNPPQSYDDALRRHERIFKQINTKKSDDNIPNDIPAWVKDFFHPKTLNEILLWVKVLLDKREWFLLACLMGILHHQRPGFLSYPSSHGAPYLRIKKFPKEIYPELYEYRSVSDRLLKKIARAYKQIPELNFSIDRNVYHCDAIHFRKTPKGKTTIITSPPYMKSLTYARDNRLRLWFLGYPDWEELDKIISVRKMEFSVLMERCFKKWAMFQKSGDYCILVIGDIIYDNKDALSLPGFMCDIAKKNGYLIHNIFDYPINMDRKIEKKKTQIQTEKICVFKRR